MLKAGATFSHGACIERFTAWGPCKGSNDVIRVEA